MAASTSRRNTPRIPRTAAPHAILSILAGSILAASATSHAENITWLGTTSGTWNTTSNWSSNAVPGVNDTAFLWNSSASQATLSLASVTNIGSITFANSDVGGYSIGSTSGNGFHLTSGGAIQSYSSKTEWIHAPVEIEPVSATTGGTYTLSAMAAGKLSFDGGITGGATSGSITLVLTGAGTALNQIYGAGIGNGSATGGVSLIKTGAGSWNLSGANTYTGSTSINGGNLILNWGLQTNTPVTDIINASSALFLGGGTLTLSGTNKAHAQTFNGTTLTQGASSVTATSVTGGSVTLNLGSITRNAGGQANLTLPLSGSITTTATNTASSILGGWATVNGSDWAVSAATSSSLGAITALTSYTNDTWGIGNNTTVTQSSTVTSATTNSLRFGAVTKYTVTLSGSNVITSGGILQSSASAVTNTITGGTLTSGNGKDLIINNFATGANLNFNSVITDNGSTSIGLTIRGLVFFKNPSAHTYTGATYINQGLVTMSATNVLPTNTTVTFGPETTSKDSLVLAGYSQTIGALGQTAQNTSGVGNATAAVYNSGSAATLTINGQTYVGGILVNTDSTFAGIIADTSTGAINAVAPLSITKTGAGSTLTLTGANIYSGATSVQSGVLAFGSVASGTAAQALGSGSVVNIGVAAASSGTLQYNGSAGTLDKNIYALGNGLNTIKNNGYGLLTLSGSLVKNGTKLALDGGDKGMNVTGVISGENVNSDLYVTGGTVTLSNVNTYNGPTYVNGGSVLINGTTDALPQDTILQLGSSADNSTGTFDLGGHAQTVAGLNSHGTGTNVVTNNGGSNATLTVSNGGTFAGQIKDGAQAVGLSVSGGNLILSGSNTYSGATNVTGGQLTITGTTAATGGVNVSAPAALNVNGSITGAVTAAGIISGTGVISGATIVTGTLAPGNSIGTIHTGALMLSAGTLAVELGRNSSNVAVSDLVSVTGTVDLSGADLKLERYTDYTNPLLGDVFFLIDNNGINDAIVGHFATLNDIATNLAEGSTFTWNSQQWEITYTANYDTKATSGGNDLAIIAVPEPGTWAMIVSGIGMLVGVQRLRRNRFNS